jgi:hypothetical protein
MCASGGVNYLGSFSVFFLIVVIALYTFGTLDKRPDDYIFRYFVGNSLAASGTHDVFHSLPSQLSGNSERLLLIRSI